MIVTNLGINTFTDGKTKGHVYKYEAVFDSFVDIGIVVTFLSFTLIFSFRL